MSRTVDRDCRIRYGQPSSSPNGEGRPCWTLSDQDQDRVGLPRRASRQLEIAGSPAEGRASGVDGVEQLFVGLELIGAVYVNAALLLPRTEQVRVEVRRDVHGEGEGVEGSFPEHLERIAPAIADVEPGVVR
jgi:hypothetical protein